MNRTSSFIAAFIIIAGLLSMLAVNYLFDKSEHDGRQAALRVVEQRKEQAAKDLQNCQNYFGDKVAVTQAFSWCAKK